MRKFGRIFRTVVLVGMAANCSKSTQNAGSTPGFDASIVVTNTGGTTIDGGAFYSSTRLAVTWVAAAGTVDHYRLLATDGVTGAVVDASVSSATQTTLTGLKSDTTYSIVVVACATSDCSTSVASAGSAPTGRTARETWVAYATADRHDAGIRIVSDGNSKINAFAYGSVDAGAPATKAGRVQLYYGPSGSTNQSYAVAVANVAADAGDMATVTGLRSLAGDAGLIGVSTVPIFQIMTGHPVPLGGALGSKIRVFFEANTSDSKARIYYIDSKDGYIGEDFNAGPRGVCSTVDDYDGGGCAPTVALGVSGDPDGGIFANLRQLRIGVRTLDDWRWNGDPGTFMFVTVDTGGPCALTGFANQAYAVWDGAKWTVTSDCAKVLSDAQAPSLLHLGGAKFKLYYGVPSITTGKNTSSNIPWLGPKRVIYGDGARTGDAGVVEFEDWETVAQAREVDFIWPSGKALSATEEGYMDDFVHLTPTGSLDFQVMYIAWSDSSMPPVGLAASLVNP